MDWLGRFIYNLRPPISNSELATEFRLILIALANDPIGTAVVESSGVTAEAYADDVYSRFSSALDRVSREATRKGQAQRLREVLLDVANQYAADAYVSFKANELLRDVYLAATYRTESESELSPLAAATFKRAVEGVILSTSLQVLYSQYYAKFMPKDFLHLYQMMCEYSVRLQCVKYLAEVLPIMDRESFGDYRRLSEEVISQSRQDQISRLAIEYKDAIVAGNDRQIARIVEACAKIVQLIDSESDQFFRLIEVHN